MNRFLSIFLLALVLILPVTASAQQWGRGLVPGDSIRATTSTVMVYGRFAMWSDSTLAMADTTLKRDMVLGFELWRKRDAGKTFAESFASGVAGVLLNYALTPSEDRSGRVQYFIAVGAVVTVVWYAVTMAVSPGKWITP